MVPRRSGTTRQGRRQGQAAKQPDPPSWEYNADITKIKAQAGKGEPDTRLYVLDTVDGHAQPGQYDCHHCRLERGSARPSGGQLFLKLAALACAAVWNFLTTYCSMLFLMSPDGPIVHGRLGDIKLLINSCSAHGTARTG
jgi:hypothetical protein